jgi:NADH dehydrogenase
VLRSLEMADADPANAERYLTFVFVGGGYAGVEALAEMRQLVADTWRHYPALRERDPRWVLVDAAPGILAEAPGALGEAAARRLRRDGVDIRLGTRVEGVAGDVIALSDGTRLEADTLVWTAGIVPSSLVGELGLPLDDRGRIAVGPTLQVDGRTDIWALGDCAAAPNAATPGRVDPPTCQHALRQARRLVKVLRGDQRPYRYRSLGQGATLGRLKGIARIGGLEVRGVLGSMVVRWYHLSQVPQLSRALRVVADSVLSLVFGRDAVELPTAERTGKEVRDAAA